MYTNLKYKMAATGLYIKSHITNPFNFQLNGKLVYFLKPCTVILNPVLFI